MAADDTDLLQWFTGTNTSSGTGSGGDNENLAPPTVSVAKQQGQSSSVMDESSQDSLPDDAASCDGGSGGVGIFTLWGKFSINFILQIHSFFPKFFLIRIMWTLSFCPDWRSSAPFFCWFFPHRRPRQRRKMG